MTETEIEHIVLSAKTVAVVGMRDESHPETAAFQIPALIKSRGYRIFPVNPKIVSSLGEKAFARLSDLPVKPDILDVFRRPEFIPALADEILALPEAKRPATVWLQSGITHPEQEARLSAAGLNVVSDRCLGVTVSRLKPKSGN
jgi:uncharacterized protein